MPSPLLGVVREIKVKAGDKVSKGDLILYLDVAESVSAPEPSSAAADETAPVGGSGEAREVRAVSYTHLDVYKRQDSPHPSPLPEGEGT